MKKYASDLKYIGSGEYIPYLREAVEGDEEDFDIVVLYSDHEAHIHAQAAALAERDKRVEELEEELARVIPWLEAAYSRPPQTPEAVAMLDKVKKAALAAVEVKP
jgi:predicted dinucleotide-utilizing enzyme